MTPTRIPDRGSAPQFLRTRDLRAAHWRARDVRAAVAGGRLVQLRQGAYCPPTTDGDCVSAGSARGRLACVSELRRRGVFVLEHARTHVHIDPGAARVPCIAQRRTHRERLVRAPHPQALSVDVFDALRQAVQCQTPRAAVATIDSAVYLGVFPRDELDELFATLPGGTGGSDASSMSARSPARRLSCC